MYINILFETLSNLFLINLSFAASIICFLLLFTSIRDERFYSNFSLIVLGIGLLDSLLLLFFKITNSFSWLEIAINTTSLPVLRHFRVTTTGLIITALSYLLTIITAVFSKQYLHKEAGFPRFYLLLLLFCFGMLISANSESFHGIYIGWEVVGLTSFLLIAFFYHREKSVHRAVRIYAWYKFADFFLLISIALAFVESDNRSFALIAELCLCIAVLIKSVLDKPAFAWLRNRLFYESSKEVHFVHLPLIYTEKFIKGFNLFIDKVLQVIKLKRFFDPKEFLSVLLLAFAVLFFVAQSFGVVTFGSLIWLSYLLIIAALYFVLSTNGIKELPRALLLFHLGLVTIQIVKIKTQYDVEFILAEALSLLIAFCGLLLSKSLLQRRFGKDYVDYHSGLVTVCPEAATCIFLSILSLVGFPGTIGSFSEEYIVDHLATLGPLIFLVPLSFTMLACVLVQRECNIGF